MFAQQRKGVCCAYMKSSPINERLFVGDDLEIYLDGRNRLTKSSSSKDGYIFVRVKEHGTRRHYLVHRLIASVYCHGYSPDLQVNHRNGVKHDNRPCNLEWVTQSENMTHAHDSGLARNGDRSPRSKVSSRHVLEIKSMLSSGFTRSYLADMYSVSYSTIGDIETGRSWARVGT